ncbi:MAG: effector-associated domain EAD1-containing protein [Myxococcota bacterium]
MAEAPDGDQTQEFQRLHRFLTRPGPRFGLALALVQDPHSFEQTRNTVEQRVTGEGSTVHTLTLNATHRNADLTAHMQVTSEGANCLFVIGLDELLRDRAGRMLATTAIANLNHNRDKLPTMLDVRVVLWLLEASYPSFRHFAWDLHEVMLTRAEFGSTRLRRTDDFTSEGEWIDELAKVAWEPYVARLVAKEAGFPTQRLPVFDDPRVFWARVVHSAANGAIVGGTDAILHAAARRHPDNPVFRRHLAGRGFDD